ncbi:ABC transporter permease [Sedimentitalea todarodis]|uniref:ABC transporter permease subunit n=1 Tax=Sedimentitalea todarodis TaxID=1631240 RepID=A0ABU3VEC9_9RHOB|nr:ABC transporter permease subunit [Sedimentitalea todarodis]MDU9004375.1 ABC transporter permease subunit [Sedimentitalea todarodis]
MIYRVALTTLGVLAAIVLWQTLSVLNADSFVIAGPVEVALWLKANAGLVARATVATLSAAFWGFVSGNLVAVAIAALVIVVPRTERLVSFAALVVFCLPLVATGPILRVLYGTGAGPQITLAALATYYTTYLALVVGLRAVPAGWTDLVRLYGRGPLTALRVVRMRACVPYLLAGLQIAAPAAVLGAMVGEFTGAERGLGVLTLRAMRSLDVVATWGIAAVAATVSIFAYLAIGPLSRLRGDGPPVLILSAGSPDARASFALRTVEAIGVTVVLVLVWQIAMDAFGLPQFFAKRPGDILTYLRDPTASDTLLAALWETLVWTVPGYAAGLLLGAGLAAALTLVPRAVGLVLPLAVMLRSVPIITTAPLLVLALGRGAAGTISIVAILIFFPSFVACLYGLAQTPGQVRDVFASYGAGRLRLLISAQIPAMLPSFFASARMAVPAALLAVTTTEWLATGRGIGTLMALTASTSDYNMLWSAVVAVSLIAVIAYLLVEAIERRVLGRYAAEQLA